MNYVQKLLIGKENVTEFQLYVILDRLQTYRKGGRKYELEPKQKVHNGQGVFTITFNATLPYWVNMSPNQFNFRVKFGKRNGKASLVVIDLNKHKRNRKKRYMQIGDEDYIHELYMRWKLESA